MSDSFDPMDLLDLAEELRDLNREGKPLQTECFQVVADEYDVPLAEVIAALAHCPEVAPVKEHNATIEVCVGRCQYTGGAGLLRTLVELQSAGKLNADLRPKTCLDVCEMAPVMRTRSSAGTFLHKQVQVKDLQLLLEASLEDR